MKRIYSSISLNTARWAVCQFALSTLVVAGLAKSVDERVEDLLGQMTLEEKVAQMRIFHASRGIELSAEGELELSSEVVERLRHGIAGIKNPGEHESAERAAELTNQLQRTIIESNRLGIPALFVTEAYNGVDAAEGTRFGRPINMAASWEPALTEQVWDVIGREARLRGLHMCHSPEADLSRDPRFGRMSEAFGEDTWLTSEMVTHAILGVQGRYDGLASTHIGAVVKHYAGYGQVEGGRNFASAQISPRDLMDQILPPFKAAVQRGQALGVMASHADINGVASHANPWLLGDVLRDDWGFEGYTVSDANDIARLYFFMGVAKDEDDAALMGLKAGMDVDLYSDDCYSRLPRLVRENPELEVLVDRSVRHLLRTKMIVGLFDNPFVDQTKVRSGVRANSSLELARRLDEESIILLKNDAGALPLDLSQLGSVALIGPLLGEGAEDAFRGVWGATVELRIEQGFELTDGDHNIPHLLSDEECRPGLEKALQVARESDVAVLFLGGDEFTAKEAYFAGALGDRASLDPVGLQNELLERVKALGKPVIVVLKHRRTLAINDIAEKADAILDAWDLGELGDVALARVLSGVVNPSGKLPVTVPRSVGQLPFHYSQKSINFKKGYLFIGEGPLYPFGYGLSYTNFEYGEPKLSASEIRVGGSVTVSVVVKNVGERAGKEVVQLYLRDLIGSTLRPLKELKAFEKVLLEPGESRTVIFNILPEAMACTGIDMKRKVESGEFEVQVGGSSQDVRSVRFRVLE